MSKLELSKKAILLVIVCVSLLACEASAGEVINDTYQDYCINWVLWIITTQKLIDCNWLGLWGLFWYNDNGAMAEKCFKTGFVGTRVQFTGMRDFDERNEATAEEEEENN